MPQCSLDDLFVLAEATPFFEDLLASLHQPEHFGTQLTHQWLMQKSADKLLEDVGVQIDREMNGYDPDEPAPGRETARLNAAYQPVAQARIKNVLQNTYACLEASRLPDAAKAAAKTALKGIMQKLQVPMSQAMPQPPGRRSFKIWK